MPSCRAHCCLAAHSHVPTRMSISQGSYERFQREWHLDAETKPCHDCRLTCRMWCRYEMSRKSYKQSRMNNCHSRGTKKSNRCSASCCRVFSAAAVAHCSLQEGQAQVRLFKFKQRFERMHLPYSTSWRSLVIVLHQVPAHMRMQWNLEVVQLTPQRA